MRTYIAKVDNFRAKSNQYVWIVSRCYVELVELPLSGVWVATNRNEVAVHTGNKRDVQLERAQVADFSTLTSIPDHNNFVVIHVDLSRGFYRLHVMRGARVYDGKWIGSCHNKFAVALKASLKRQCWRFAIKLSVGFEVTATRPSAFTLLRRLRTKQFGVTVTRALCFSGGAAGFGPKMLCEFCCHRFRCCFA